MIYEFGPYRLDSSERLLLRDGKIIPLTAKVFDILCLLVRKSGHLVEKNEIMGEVWSDSIVEDNNLTVGISALRKALGEGQNQQHYIETVPKRGYRFVAAVRELKSEEGVDVKAPESKAGTIGGSLPYTGNLEAFRFYSKGRYFWNKRSAEGFEKAVKYFSRAIELDPSYALAYAGLADAYALLADYNFREPHEAMSRAKAAALRALEIDDALAEAHASLGFIKSAYEWDWAGAEREFKRAVELNPNYVTAHHWYSTYLRCMGRFDEAIAELRRAQILEPTSLAINVAIGSCLYLARRYDQAIIQCRETLELDPANTSAHFSLGSAYTQKGMYEEATQAYLKALKLADYAQGWALLAYSYAVSGNKDKALGILEKLKETSKKSYVDPAYLAVICAGLADKEQAFEWLERAYEQRSDSLMFLKVDPELDGLRSDSRFNDLLRRLNLDSGPVTYAEANNSLAVLPLANKSNDPGMEYLSTGIAESIINSLSQLSSLKVLAPSTVFRYKEHDIDPLELGNKLKVSAVLVGKILQVDESLVITTELVNAADGSQMWGAQYRRPYSDLFLVQEEIAHEVSEKLRLRLTHEEKERINRRYTESIEAYHLYLKGRYFWSKYTVPEMEKGLDYFRQAINVDPNYALAYAGMADSYQRLSNFIFPSKEAMPKAKAAAMKALEIDNTVAEAHLALGLVKMYYHHDWEGAESELKKAIGLAPKSPLAYQRYGTFLMYMGRMDEALSQFNLAKSLDPLSLPINSNIGTNLYLQGRYDEAIAQLQTVLELEPRYYQAHANLGMAYIHKGEFSKGLAQLRKAKRIDKNPVLLGLFGYSYAVSGKRTEALKVLEELKTISKKAYVTPFSMALIHIGLGEKKEAFEWLAKTCEEQNDWLIWFKVGPELDSLRSDPRFVELLRRIGFPP